MTITLAHVGPLVALLAGILILIVPRLLNYIVAIYLIFVGITGLWPGCCISRRTDTTEDRKRARSAPGIRPPSSVLSPQPSDWNPRPLRALPCYRRVVMTISLALQPLVALIAGILILLIPPLLNFIVAIYLIIIG